MRFWLALTTSLLAVPLVQAAERTTSERSASHREPKVIPSPITDRLAVRGSYYTPTISTIMRVDSDDEELGTVFSGEDDVGLDDKLNQGRLEVIMRVKNRGRVRFDYFKADRFGDVILQKDILFRNEGFEAGERAITSLDWRMTAATFSYSLIRTDRFEVGVGLGMIAFEAEATEEVPTQERRDEASGTGIVPTAALDGTWRISSKWALTARGNYLSASSDRFEGSIEDYHADVQYRWKPNFAIGLGYSQFTADLELDDSDFTGFFNFEVKGPEIFFRASF